MRYDIIITAIRNPRAKPILAHRMAQDPAMPLQKALVSLEAAPVTYLRDVAEVEAAQALLQCKKLGVDARVVPRQESAGKPVEQPPRARTPMVDGHPARERRPRPVQSAFVGTSPQSSNRAAVAAMAITAAVVVLAVAGLAVFGRHRNVRRSAKPSAMEAAADARGSKPSADPQDKGVRRTKPDSHGRDSQGATSKPSATQRTESLNYADSARASASLPAAIRFYQAALAFNKRNLDAWQGLINAYRDAGMGAEAAQAQADMRRIFGGNAGSVAEAVAPFGTPQDLSFDENGTLRLEYLSKSSGEDELTKETYRLLRAARTACGCTALSVHAHTAAGEDMAVFLDAPRFPASLDEYRATARITYLK